MEGTELEQKASGAGREGLSERGHAHVGMKNLTGKERSFELEEFIDMDQGRFSAIDGERERSCERDKKRKMPEKKRRMKKWGGLAS